MCEGMRALTGIFNYEDIQRFSHALDLMLVYQTLPLWLSFGTASYRPSFIFNTVSVYTFKTVFYKFVLKVAVFTAQPIKQARLKYSVWECNLGM